MSDVGAALETPLSFERQEEPSATKTPSYPEKVKEYGQGAMGRLSKVVERLGLTSLGPAVPAIQKVQQLVALLPAKLYSREAESLRSSIPFRQAFVQQFQESWLKFTLPTQLHVQIEGINRTMRQIADLPTHEEFAQDETAQKAILQEKAANQLEKGMLPHQLKDLQYAMAQLREDTQRERAELESLLVKMVERKEQLLALVERNDHVAN